MVQWPNDPDRYLEDVAEKYRSKDKIWAETDKWNLATKARIEAAINHFVAPVVTHDTKILNLGSGGNSYGLFGKFHLHVDIVKEKLTAVDNYIICNIEDIPLDDDQ